MLPLPHFTLWPSIHVILTRTQPKLEFLNRFPNYSKLARALIWTDL